MILNRWSQADRFSELDGEFCVGSLVPGMTSELALLEADLAQELFSWPRFKYRTEAGGKITAVQDSVAAGVGARAINDAHAFANASAPNQPDACTVDAALNGQLSSVFGGSAWLDSNIAASNWRVHDGTGWIRAYVFVPTAVTSSTILGSALLASVSGFQDLVSGAGLFLGTVFNASAAILNLSAVQAMVNGTGYYGLISYQEGSSPEGLLYRGDELDASGDTTGAPLIGDPSFTCCLGTRGNRAVPFRGRMAEAMFAKYTSTAQRDALIANIQRYTLLTYGLT